MADVENLPHEHMNSLIFIVVCFFVAVGKKHAYEKQEQPAGRQISGKGRPGKQFHFTQQKTTG